MAILRWICVILGAIAMGLEVIDSINGKCGCWGLCPDSIPRMAIVFLAFGLLAIITIHALFQLARDGTSPKLATWARALAPVCVATVLFFVLGSIPQRRAQPPAECSGYGPLPFAGAGYV